MTPVSNQSIKSRIVAYPTRILLGLLALAAVLYALTYIGLSMQGRYEPAVLGLGHVKQYGWAPAGFVRDDRWNFYVQGFYLPLYRLDERFWHCPSLAEDDIYPIHRVESPQEFARVYRQWSSR